MKLPIVIIGPMAAGKTIVASLLAEKLGLVHTELDDCRWDYYDEIGYDRARVEKIHAEQGFAGIYRYWKPFEIHALERVLSDCKDGVISFGAGHSVYEDTDLFERAKRALGQIDNVILLLPYEDVDRSVAVLIERFTEQAKAEDMIPSAHQLEFIEHFTRHPSNRRLAKHVVYTGGKTPEQTCDEIVQWLAK